MSLADHWDGGRLKAGWHHVKVMEHRLFTANSGNNGVEFTMQCVNTGSNAKEGFMLVDSILWRLANLARACGMTREEAANYDPLNPNHHRKLHGLECWVEMVKDGEYHKVDGFRSLGEGEPPPPKIDRSGEMPNASGWERGVTETKRDDDIPF